MYYLMYLAEMCLAVTLDWARFRLMTQVRRQRLKRTALFTAHQVAASGNAKEPRVPEVQFTTSRQAMLIGLSFRGQWVLSLFQTILAKVAKVESRI